MELDASRRQLAEQNQTWRGQTKGHQSATASEMDSMDYWCWWDWRWKKKLSNLWVRTLLPSKGSSFSIKVNTKNIWEHRLFPASADELQTTALTPRTTELTFLWLMKLSVLKGVHWVVVLTSVFIYLFVPFGSHSCPCSSILVQRGETQHPSVRFHVRGGESVSWGMAEIIMVLVFFFVFHNDWNFT